MLSVGKGTRFVPLPPLLLKHGTQYQSSNHSQMFPTSTDTQGQTLRSANLLPPLCSPKSVKQTNASNSPLTTLQSILFSTKSKAFSEHATTSYLSSYTTTVQSPITNPQWQHPQVTMKRTGRSHVVPHNSWQTEKHTTSKDSTTQDIPLDNRYHVLTDITKDNAG